MADTSIDCLVVVSVAMVVSSNLSNAVDSVVGKSDVSSVVEGIVVVVVVGFADGFLVGKRVYHGMSD